MADINLQQRGPGPSNGKLSKKGPRRTTFHEDGLHVGTIVEYVPETKLERPVAFCTWSTAHDGGRASDYPSAHQAMMESLQR